MEGTAATIWLIEDVFTPSIASMNMADMRDG